MKNLTKLRLFQFLNTKSFSKTETMRLIKPNILLPATTALNTVSPDGR
ncbi:MAG: hypothetical protein ACI4RU_03420 [Acutalibacteraceae bacterium]